MLTQVERNVPSSEVSDDFRPASPGPTRRQAGQATPRPGRLAHKAAFGPLISGQIAISTYLSGSYVKAIPGCLPEGPNRPKRPLFVRMSLFH